MTEQKQKILIFSLAYIPFVGGAELALKEITERLPQYEFHVITYRFDRAWARQEKVGDVIVHRVGRGRYGGSYYGRTAEKFLYMPFAFFKAVRLHQQLRFSALWCMMAGRAAGPALGMKILYPRIPLLLTLQEGDTPEYAHRRAGVTRGVWGRIFKIADTVQCISFYLKSWAEAEGAKADRVMVIPNGVDLSKFQVPSLPRCEPKVLLRGSSSQVRNTVITTSRLVPKNGIDLLIRAIAKVRQQIPDIQCVIVGDGPEKEALLSLSRELNIAERIIFKGVLSNEGIPAELSRANVFVRAARSEGQGISFLEAMAAGLPIIGTPVGGIPDFLRDGVTGLFAKAEDADDLAEKIIRLLGDASLAEKLSTAGRALVEGEYGWELIAKKFSDLFNGMLRKKILLVSGIFPPDIGGSASYASGVAGWFFRHKKIHVPILTYGDTKQSGIWGVAEPWATIVHRVSRMWPKGVPHIIFFLKCFWFARGVDTILSADASMGGGLPAYCAARLAGRKFIVRVTGEYAWEQGQARFGVADSLDEFQTKKYHPIVEILRFLEHWIVKRADAVIAPSEYLKRVIGGWGVANEKIQVIYNAVSLSARFQHALELSFEDARRELAWASDVRVFVSVGRLVPWKGFKGLLEAFRGVVGSNPEAKLFIIGDGPEREHLASQISHLNLETSVTLVGRLPQETLGVYLRAVDALVLNTAYEGFSHQLIEALALGVPTITTNVGGNPEIITHGKNGILVPYNDISALQSAMRDASGVTALRARLGAAKGEVLKKFNQDRMMNELIDLIQRI